ncbi:hypothetical protein [Kiloniella sp.]|uniref:hypothetical protein n=1 Tax=Kiloniella sp. TaxID=1938587 RepID=UPI003B01A4ED
MPRKSRQLTAYGSEQDQAMADALSAHKRVSVSKLFINYIRTEYKRIFGKEDPERIIKVLSK